MSEQAYFEAHPLEWAYRRLMRAIIAAAVAAILGMVVEDFAAHAPTRWSICIGPEGSFPEEVLSQCKSTAAGVPTTPEHW